jgi:delta14-sterol reductase/lamin-B receptor
MVAITSTSTTTTHPSSTTKRSASKAQFHYEFGGPWGALSIILALPIVILLLAHWTHVGYVDLQPLQTFDKAVLCPNCGDLSTLWQCTGIVVGWFVFQIILEKCLPCQLVQGTPLPSADGGSASSDKPTHLTYRINGHLAFWVTLFVVQALGWPTWHEASQTLQFDKSMPLEFVYQHYSTLAFLAVVFCMLGSICLYLASFSATILAKGGNSGNPIYDFYMGRELNPRSLGIDWKFFCELRPGLIAWMLLNLACLRQQRVRLGYVTPSMYLINLLQGIYVWDALYQEQAIVTTMDITTDGFGFMLCFGDLAWVPFTYSAQARYLVEHDPHLGYGTLSLIMALYLLGFYIFRSANGQKDLFRRNPNDPQVANLKVLSVQRRATTEKSATRTKLLVDGWWGMARKINYTGDYLMGLSWCCLCGFDSIVPYFYAVYFLILLIHRSMRDDQLCQEKYGSDWDTYKKMVPYRFIPGVI